MHPTVQRPHIVLIFLFASAIFFAGCFERISPVKERENDRYDGPDQAARFEFERTKDPATGKVPSERLLTALYQTMQSRQTMRGNNGTSLPLLSWTERGPNSDGVGPSNGNTRANGGVTSGRIRAIMVDSADPTHKTVWVGGVDGGLWKTTDITASPANWIPVNDFLSNLAVSAICQDPTDYNTMYFCTGESYFNFEAVAGVGVFKSTDHGITWNYLPATSAYARCTRILCDYQGNVYLANRGYGVLRSVKASGGAIWTPITPAAVATPNICDMEISSTSGPGRLHIVTGIFSTQAYFYTDIPATVSSSSGWNSPVTPFPSYANRAEIAVSGNTLYAAPANASNQVPTIYKSIDGGANWTATASQPDGGNWASGQGWYSLSVVINPADPNQCIVGGLDNYKTTNGGTSWTQISQWYGTSVQYVHADQHHALWWDGGNKLMFACDGGIHFSSNGGTTIRDRNVGLRLKQFYSVAMHPTTTDYFLAGAQDNGTHQITGPGLTSSVEVTGGDGAFVAIDQDQPQYQFGAYVYNQYRRSTDGGATWDAVSFSTSAGGFINPWDYDNTGNKLYAAYSPGQYLRWEDPQTGATANIINVPSLNGIQVSAVSVSPYTPNRVYFGTAGGRVVKVDAANTAAPLDVNITGAGMPAVNLSCLATGTDDQNLMASYSNFGVNNIWVTSNGGASWTNIDGNLPDMPVRWCMFFPGDNTKAYIATETGVWETDLVNGGSTIWTSDPTFPTVRTDMIKFRPSDRTIAAGTHGRGVWTATVPSAGCTPPFISASPANSSICELANTSFSVIAGGTAPLSYQWQLSTDGGLSFNTLTSVSPYSNVSTATMNITGATLAMNHYRYRCLVTGACAPPVYSNQAMLNVGAIVNAGNITGTTPLCVGFNTGYSATGSPGGTWSSSAPGVATVDAASGIITAVNAGTAMITYTVSGCNGIFAASKIVTVSPNVVSGTVSGASPLCTGLTAAYICNGTAGGSWASSTPGVASVNASSGLVTALSAGTTTITYTVSGCGGTVSASKILTVTMGANAGTVSGTSPLCVIGGTATYASNGDPGGTWSSSTPAVATVNASSGLVTAVSLGTATITYTVSGCNGPASASKILTVTTGASAGSISGATPLCINAAATYTSNGNSGGTWASSSPAIATINSVSGMVTAISAGTTTISYTVNGCSGTITTSKLLTVSPNASAGAVIGNSPLCIGAISNYGSNGDPGGAWSSSNPAVATVDASSGMVTAISSGTTNITYSVNGCGGLLQSYKTLMVLLNIIPGTVSGNSPLCMGVTATYTWNGTSGGTWSSSNTAIATVNAFTGLVTAVAAGTTNIIYTLVGCGGTAISSAVLTVRPNASAGIVSGDPILCAGSTALYSSTGNTGGIWSSSAPGVATVNTAGLVTAAGAGTSLITYTDNGCYGPVSASQAVTVNPLPQGSLSANGPFAGSGNGMLTWTATAGTGPFTIVYSDGIANRTVSGVMSGVAFNVFTNPVTSTTTYTLVSVSDANCTRATAFTGPSATISVSGGSCNGYSIVGLKEINLGENNLVNGDVGNTAAGKKADINKNSTINGLISASVITLHPPVTVTGGLFYTPAVVSLPPMLLNTAVVPSGNFTVPDNGTATINNNYHDLTIGKNAVVTINGTIYGNMHIKTAARVTFTAPDINIDQLQTEDGDNSPLAYTIINFSNNANVRIKNKVELGARNRVNETNSKIVFFYLGDLSNSAEQFNVNGTDTRVTAGVYMPVGKINIGNNGPCSMTGTFISEIISSSKNVTWNCGNVIPAVIPDVHSLVKGGDFSLKVYPNPSSGEFNIQVKSESNEPVSIRIFDALGRLVSNTIESASKAELVRIGRDLVNGIYFAEVKQGSRVETLKLVRLK